MFDFYSQLTLFSGRTTRLNYWIFRVSWYVLNLSCVYLLLMYFGVHKMMWTKFGYALRPEDLMQMQQVLISRMLNFMVYPAMRYVAYALGIFYVAAMLLPYVATTVRRLHDLNRSGWWALLAHGATILLILVLVVFQWLLVSYGRVDWLPVYNEMAVTIITGFMIGLNAFCFAALFLWPGTRGPNKYGPDPREIDSYIKQRRAEFLLKKQLKQDTGRQS